MSIIKLQGEEELCRQIHYEVDTTVGPIGEDGMGRVFKGAMVDERMGFTRPVAVKFMFDGLPASAYERARREANIRLHNDNLIEMFGFIEIQVSDDMESIKKRYYIVSEYIEGVSLSDLLEGKVTDCYGQKVPYAMELLADCSKNSEHFAMVVVLSVVSGLVALHDAGYIHCDIDPSNIIITNNGQIKLMNFGIAKHIDSFTTDDKSLTVPGNFMGMPKYAAPEIILGDITHQNQTTDIYAVGILLYQCITGHTPFDALHHEILQKQLKDKIPLDAIKNKGLRNIIATACNKRQDLRYQSLEKMRMALVKWQRPTATPLMLKVLTVPVAVIATPISMVTSGINSIVSTIKERKRLAKQLGISYRPAYNTVDADLTYSSIYAPAEVKLKSRMQIQVYLHLFEEKEKISRLAMESDKMAERRDFIPLQCKLKKGDKLDVLLNIYGETLLMSDKKSVVWQGSFTKCSFDYFVPKDIDVDELSCVAFLSVNGIPVGEMRFISKIVESPRQLNPEIIAHKYNKVFISYAHKDEAKVKSFHEGLKLAAIEHFYDRAYLKAGDIFPQVIKDYINSADLFVLFWSENAALSDYVQKERTLALERAFPQVKPQHSAKLSIYPISIEPRAELPCDMKDNYHFGDI